MNKPIFVFLLLGTCLSLSLATVFIVRVFTDEQGPAGIAGTSISDAGDPDHPGVAYGDIPWKHFQSVPQFHLTDQAGRKFDSASLAGKPYAIGFFYSSCPSICREMNERIEDLNRRLKDTSMNFLSITVQPEVDTPEVLQRYAEDFGADVQRWKFLTGQKYEIQQLGIQVFRANLTPETHTEDIMLIDKWGRWRDRFKWDDPYDMKRLVKVAAELDLETAPPVEDVFRTRNLMAGVPPSAIGDVPWLREFHLTRSSGESFFSKEMTGRVWVCSFFFTTCPGICTEQNNYLAGLRSRLSDTTLVSITTDPDTDTPAVLAGYARNLGAEEESWIFCTGEDLVIRRTSEEFFGAHASGGHHSSLLFVVDRWGNVRGEYDWQKPEHEAAMLELIDGLNDESAPPPSFEIENRE